MIKKIFAFLLISTVVFTACKKDEDNNLSTQESKIVLTEAGNDINTDLTEITNSDGAKSIIDIFNIININDPFTGTQKSVKITKRHFPYLSKLIYIPKIEKRFVHIRKLVDQEPYIMPGMLAIFGLLVGFASALLLGF